MHYLTFLALISATVYATQLIAPKNSFVEKDKEFCVIDQDENEIVSVIRTEEDKLTIKSLNPLIIDELQKRIQNILKKLPFNYHDFQDTLLYSGLGPHTVRNIVFLGTGDSFAVPYVNCLTTESPTCIVCKDAQNHGSRNRRSNTSLLIQYKDTTDQMKNVIIDVGKSFYSVASSLLVKLHVRFLDGVILTHDHADAMLGLDDLRHYTYGDNSQSSVPIYLTKDTFSTCKSAFPYLCPENTGAENKSSITASLAFNVFATTETIKIANLDFIPIPVEHGQKNGRPYMSLGFLFDGIAYLSDVSKIPDESLKILEAKPPCCLIIDCAGFVVKYSTHLTANESFKVIRQIKPKVAFLIGMNHSIDYDQFQDLVSKEFKDDNTEVWVSYDGLTVSF